MALSATVFKVELGVSDVDHGYYADHALTVFDDDNGVYAGLVRMLM